MKDAMRVMKTNDYSIFKTIDGNRQVQQKNVNNLIQSMKEKLLMCPIIVNEDNEVIDGQNRLQALKLLKLPVYYLPVKGYGIREVQMLNTYQKDWGINDFMDCYSKEGRNNYILYKQFYTKWKFNHQESMNLLIGEINNRDVYYAFRQGTFTVKSYQEAERKAQKIKLVSEYYAGYKRRSFVQALLYCFQNDEYNHAKLIQKLRYQSTKLVDCTTTDAYLSLIEDIYNFKSKMSDRIRLY